MQCMTHQFDIGARVNNNDKHRAVRRSRIDGDCCVMIAAGNRAGMIKAKFHYTDPTGPDRTFVGD